MSRVESAVAYDGMEVARPLTTCEEMKALETQMIQKGLGHRLKEPWRYNSRDARAKKIRTILEESDVHLNSLQMGYVDDSVGTIQQEQGEKETTVALDTLRVELTQRVSELSHQYPESTDLLLSEWEAVEQLIQQSKVGNGIVIPAAAKTIRNRIRRLSISNGSSKALNKGKKRPSRARYEEDEYADYVQ
ncbi:hypothetical protein HY285_04605 [Candidatus Peregrinibacteria bacterium]|nr:hypothetical protein [Candidatus Peregrinibacteria bacterium]MBI3816793.1 hypothetical protein [Candidatus Peregrinibacteria bacterium]